MPRNAVSTVELRQALSELSVVAAIAATGRGDARARRSLRASIEQAQEILGAPTDGIPPMAVSDADALVEAYLAAGGDWTKLAAAVNRNALNASTRRKPE